MHPRIILYSICGFMWALLYNSFLQLILSYHANFQLKPKTTYFFFTMQRFLKNEIPCKESDQRPHCVSHTARAFLNSSSSFYFRHKLYTSIMSRIPTFRPSSKAVFSHAQHTVPCRSMIFSQRGILSPT